MEDSADPPNDIAADTIHAPYQVEYDPSELGPAPPILTPEIRDIEHPATPNLTSRILKNLFGAEKRTPSKEEILQRQSLDQPCLEDPGESQHGGNCFICLEDGYRKPLVTCCSQCSAVVHRKCWYKWRRKQRLATLRARLLATNVTDPLCCTICKTGIAQIQGEEDQLSWAAGDPFQQRLQDKLLNIIGVMLQATRGDDEESVSLPPAVMQRVAVVAALVLSFGILVDVLLFTFSQISYWGFIVIPTFAFLYLLGSLSCVAISIYQRKLALGPLRQRPGPTRSQRLSPRALETAYRQLPLEALAAQGRRAYCHDVCVELWNSSGQTDVVVFFKSGGS